jgi:hypothetical protein
MFKHYMLIFHVIPHGHHQIHYQKYANIILIALILTGKFKGKIVFFPRILLIPSESQKLRFVIITIQKV